MMTPERGTRGGGRRDRRKTGKAGPVTIAGFVVLSAGHGGHRSEGRVKASCFLNRFTW